MLGTNFGEVANDAKEYTRRNPVTVGGGGILAVSAVALLLSSCEPEGSTDAVETNSPIDVSTQIDTTIINPNICKVQEGTATGANHVLVGQNLAPNSIAFTTDPAARSKIGGSNIPYRLPNILDDTSNALSVHFLFDKFSLDQGDKTDLRKFAEQINSTITGKMTLVIEGHADSRGTEERNDTISHQRANVVKSFIEPLLKDGITVQLASFGSRGAEALPFNTHEERLAHRPFRKVTLVPTENIITRALDQSPADIFLLDASGSMSGSSWNAVTSFDYPDAAEIFTFTTANKNGCAEDLGGQRVNGATPLYKSLLEIVSNPESSGKTVTLLSDGDDTEGGDIDEIIRLAQENNIKINTIGVKDYPKATLTKIANETGGQPYFQL